MNDKPILCIDFDGVLHSYVSGWKGAAVIPDPPVPGAIAFLYEATLHFDVHVFSSRSHQKGGIEAMQAWITQWEATWLTEQRMLDISRMYPSLLLAIKWPIEKPAAFLTIDDRALTFTGEWPAMADLLAFRPWNKK